MVLQELGSRISKALRNMTNSTVVDDKVIDELLKEVCNALVASDVNFRLVVRMKQNIKQVVSSESGAANKRRILQETVFRELCRLLDPGTKPFLPKKGQSNVIMFVGLQGSGKTTTCTKLAHFYRKKGWKVCLVCADTFRAGAYDQLKMNATKANIPYFGSYSESDPVKIAHEGVEHFKKERFEIIIVDTSGRHKQEVALFDEMEQVAKAVLPNDIIFVMDGSIGQAAFDQASAFKSKVDVGSVIITKLDGHAKGGGALSAVAATKSPIVFIGTGEQFDDFEKFEARSFVSRLLGYGDMAGLVEKATEVGLTQQPEMYERMITEGVFTMRDMREQFQNITKMGSLSQVVSMIPGFTQELLPKGKEREGQLRIKKFLVIIDSFTNEELDNKDLAKIQNLESRVKRIARGSGRTINEVNELISQFKTFQKMIGKMKDLNLGKLRSPKDLQNFTKGSNLAQLSKAMDPNLLRGIGGAGGLQNMMRQFSNNMGNIPGLAGLMRRENQDEEKEK